MAAHVVGPIQELRNGSRAMLTVDGLEGWDIRVRTHDGPLGERIVSLELHASSDELVLTADQLRRCAPVELLAAMSDSWVLSTNKALPKPSPLPAGTRERRGDDYLRALAVAALEVQGKVKSTRRELAQRFGRSESQIRDDLNRARQVGYLMPQEARTRRVERGPLLAPTKRTRKGAKQ